MNVPKIRFSEFSEEWKEEKLKVSSEVYDGTHETPNYISSGVKFISVENINDFYNSDKYISEEDYEKYKIKPVKNDIFMTRIGDIGTSNIYDGTEKLAYYVSLALIRTELYPPFLNQYIKSNNFQKELHNKTIHVAFPKKINTGEIGECKIKKCAEKEQKKIADFLSLLDKKIELQSKKVEALKLYKKGLLENIINNYKSDFISLKKILKERKTYSEKGFEYPHVTLSKDGIYDKGERYNRDFLVKEEDKNYKITHLNDLCYNPANLKFGVICLNEYGSAIFSPIYVTFEIMDYEPKFLKHYLTRSNFINKIRKYEQGTVYERMAVNQEDFLKGEIHKVSSNDQIRLVNIMEKIELKIFIENDKLIKLNELKKGLMQKMFV